jgi:hypothetical protein
MTMKTPKEYRLRAKECLRLANEATEFYVKVALAELATEFRKTADCMEPRHARANARRCHRRPARKGAVASSSMTTSASDRWR